MGTEPWRLRAFLKVVYGARNKHPDGTAYKFITASLVGGESHNSTMLQADKS